MWQTITCHPHINSSRAFTSSHSSSLNQLTGYSTESKAFCRSYRHIHLASTWKWPPVWQRLHLHMSFPICILTDWCVVDLHRRRLTQVDQVAEIVTLWQPWKWGWYPSSCQYTENLFHQLCSYTRTMIPLFSTSGTPYNSTTALRIERRLSVTNLSSENNFERGAILTNL